MVHLSMREKERREEERRYEREKKGHSVKNQASRKVRLTRARVTREIGLQKMASKSQQGRALERANTVSGGLGHAIRAAAQAAAAPVAEGGSFKLRGGRHQRSSLTTTLEASGSDPAGISDQHSHSGHPGCGVGIRRLGEANSGSFSNFCRGSLKRLQKAEDQVTEAKKDMEDILNAAKVRSLYSEQSTFPSQNT